MSRAKIKKTVHILETPKHASPIELTLVEYPHVVVLLGFSKIAVTGDAWQWVFTEWVTPIFEEHCHSGKFAVLIGPNGSVE
jgi:hypothetical protein